MSIRERIRGVLGFPVTPFRQDLSLDLDALARNVDEMARYPFCALVAAGGTGELYSLTAAEVEDVVRVTVQAAAGRMPVVAGHGLQRPAGRRYGEARRKGGGRVHSGAAPLLHQRAVRGRHRLLPGNRRR